MEPGTRLGPYEIIAPLGAGGMGEVWRARDLRLHRDVAVKLLLADAMSSASATARFEREARAVAALSHPNILAIHDFGTDSGVSYAVIELLEGATLRDRLRQAAVPVARALEWGLQIAQGLAAAHERGIVHRDLKPENIFVTRDGIVKILDFGLAQMDERKHPILSAEAATQVRTTPGMVVGTLAYLAPEQARGEAADQRSDIFGFGAVFYEMLTGTPAFLRPSPVDTLVAILREEPRLPSDSGRVVPGEVLDILHHCLEKDAEERFRSARDLAFALKLASRSLVSPSTPASSEAQRVTPRPQETSSGVRDLSIAVLPFRNISPDADGEYFSDGMTEEIINALAAVTGLRVAARTSSFAFKTRDDDIRRIGRELGVAMVLEGSVRQAASRLRVTVQLVDVENGYHVWSNRWDRDRSDVFAVQDEIAEAIASTLKLRVAEKDSAGAGRTQNVEAYDRYLRGRYLWGQRRGGEAIVELEAAIERDPDFAEAYTAIADAWAVRGYYGGVAPWEAWARSRAALEEAQRLGLDSESVALSLAILEHYFGWNSAREEQYCRLAIERNPKSAEGWTWLAVCYAGSGRAEDAVAAGARGIELEPHHANLRTSQAWGYGIAGSYEKALPLIERAIEIDPTGTYPRWSYGHLLRFAGRVTEAIDVLERLVEDTHGRAGMVVCLLAAALAHGGETSRAEELREQLETRRRNGDYVAPFDLAFIDIALGDHERALTSLERAYEERSAFLWGRIHFPDFIPLHGHPRWQAVEQKAGRNAPFASG